jgi:hypothetical protein
MALRSRAASEAARWMMDDIYASFVDADGNFLEQLQTTGFDARVFEFYLYAYFLRTRLLVPRANPVPDFLVSSSDLTAAVEATTVNPSVSGVLAAIGRKISDLDPSELMAYRRTNSLSATEALSYPNCGNDTGSFRTAQAGHSSWPSRRSMTRTRLAWPRAHSRVTCTVSNPSGRERQKDP